jgi:predicted nucleotidyltransferase
LKRAEPFVSLVAALNRRRVQFVVIGVWGVNYYGSGSTHFHTEDRDLFLPTDPDNELKAWLSCRSEGFELWCGDEPLGRPVDRVLAEQVVSRRALVRAEGHGLLVDLTLVMAGFTFEDVWPRRRLFKVEGIALPVARLRDIVASKAAAGRPKDRLFLATHEEALRELGRRRHGRLSADSTKRHGRR